MDPPIYLDYNATTPVDARAMEAMAPWFTERFWNASSAHASGQLASDAVDTARRQVASLLGASPGEIVFTSGATEANNLALKGTVEAAPTNRDRVVVAATEHKAVLDVADWLSEHGSDVVVVPVGRDGAIDLDTYRAAVDDRTVIASVMAANNETGVLSPLRALADIAHEVGALFHTDATQALGRIPFDVDQAGVDLASFSGHKMYGPKGVGGLHVRRNVRIAPMMHGGGHEADLRSGTLNVPGIVGLGAAADIAGSELGDDSERFRKLTGLLVSELLALSPDAVLVGDQSARLPNTVNVHFPDADAEAVMVNAPEVAVSSGSACTARVPAPSHVLLAMGVEHEAAQQCLRFSVGRPTTESEVRSAVGRVIEAVKRVRNLGG